MIEVEIPNDIKDYEPKILGPFTLRQIICVIGIAITSAAGYIILNKFFDNGLRVIIPMVLDVPWALIGYYKPYGMKFEKYFISQLYTTIIPPKRRKYKTENLYDVFDKEIDAEEKTKLQTQTNSKPKKEKKEAKS